MSELARWSTTWVCAFGFAACGYAPLGAVGGDGGAGSDAGGEGPTEPPPGGMPFQSCAKLAANCGANGNDSCCRSLPVPGGTFDRSFDHANDGMFTNTTLPATVSGFSLDKYEVSVARFRAFVNAGMGLQLTAPPGGAGAHASSGTSGWSAIWDQQLQDSTDQLEAALACDTTTNTGTWTHEVGGNENRPINCVDWFEAMAFCIWDGGYLPSEAEWNYAASGGAEQRAYPWSTPASSLTIDTSHASYQDANGCGADGLPQCTLNDLLAVGTRPAGDGKWGQSDLAGNVYEWTVDVFEPYANPCNDCIVLVDPSIVSPVHSRRGGGFLDDTTDARASFRDSAYPQFRAPDLGIRCARPQ